MTFVLLGLLFIPSHTLGAAPYTPVSAQTCREPVIVLDTRITPNAVFYSELRLVRPDWIRKIANSQRKLSEIPDSDVQLTYCHRGREWKLVVTEKGEVYDPETESALLIPKSLQQKLSKAAGELRSRHYGKLLPWDEVNRRIPNKTKITILDMETGLSFRAQRRAGNSHADVQPLSKKDTEIMRRIYGGKWSWNRRPVLVITERESIAASMNGMPHGGDGIPHNNFSGHFCVHFRNSTTHKSRTTDAAHQAMIFRAAGKISSYLESLNPAGLAELYVAALNQQDLDLIKKLVPDNNGKPSHPFANEMENLKTVRLVSMTHSPETFRFLTASVPVQIAVYRNNAKMKQSSLQIICRRASLTDPWKISDILLN